MNRYSVRCETEGRDVHVWAETPPTTCPNNAAHTIDPTLTRVVDIVASSSNVISNLPLTPFDRLLTSEETIILEIKPGLGVSKLRDTTHIAGDSEVRCEIGAAEYTLATTGPNGVAMLRTAERGRYVSGLAAEVGIGGHLMAPLGPGQSLKFGLFDDNNGFYFEILYWELFVVILKDGVQTRINRTDFNIDKMDGTGTSRIELDPFKGYIWMIRFSWYGYGIVEFAISAEDPFKEQHIYPMHRYYSKVHASVSMPNLPITVKLESGSECAAAAQCAAHITGRKYSVLGNFTPMTRAGSVYTIRSPIGDANTATPVFSIRRKQGYLSAPVTLDALEAYAELTTVIVQIRTGMTLTGAVWGTAPNATATETSVEYDDSATAATGGILLYQGFARTGSAAALNNTIDFYLTERDAVTVLVKNATAAGQMSIGFRWHEEF